MNRFTFGLTILQPVVFAALVLLLAIITGCGQRQILNSVCPQEGSWICEKSEEIGVQPEQVYGFIYNAAAIAAITDVVKMKDICAFEKEVADWYVKIYPISYDALIGTVLSRALSYDKEKTLLIKNILNQNLVAYKSPKLISEPDDIILRKGHVAFRNDMLCY